MEANYTFLGQDGLIEVQCNGKTAYIQNATQELFNQIEDGADPIRDSWEDGDGRLLVELLN